MKDIITNEELKEIEKGVKEIKQGKVVSVNEIILDLLKSEI